MTAPVRARSGLATFFWVLLAGVVLGGLGVVLFVAAGERVLMLGHALVRRIEEYARWPRATPAMTRWPSGCASRWPRATA